MLTREKLNDADWTVIRDTPHLVIVGISSTGGSPMDELLEHSAGMKSIVDGMNSTHPLIREIAVGVNIMQAQKSIQSWYRSLPEIDRKPVSLQEKAIDSMKSALDVLRAHGGPEDLLQYSDFVRSLAMRWRGLPAKATSSALAANWSAPESGGSSTGSKRSRISDSRDLRVVALPRPPWFRPGAPPGRPGHIAAFSTSPLISFFFRLPTR